MLWTLIIVMILIIMIVIMTTSRYGFFGYKMEYMVEHVHNDWPKIIWTFWHDSTRIPPIVSVCIDSWMLSNPDYKVNVINNNNMHEFIDVPSSDFWKDSFTRTSDMLRLHLLERYGGIWIDSSILVRTPFSQWLFNHCDINQKQMYGFYLDSW